jgi:hypothetical protein
MPRYSIRFLMLSLGHGSRGAPHAECEQRVITLSYQDTETQV